MCVVRTIFVWLYGNATIFTAKYYGTVRKKTESQRTHKFNSKIEARKGYKNSLTKRNVVTYEDENISNEMTKSSNAISLLYNIFSYRSRWAELSRESKRLLRSKQYQRKQTTIRSIGRKQTESVRKHFIANKDHFTCHSSYGIYSTAKFNCGSNVATFAL